MLTLRFSAGKTVLLFALLPVIVSFIILMLFFLYHVVTHLGVGLNMHELWVACVLMFLHGCSTYAIPCLLLGLGVIFWLDKGMYRSHRYYFIVGASVFLLAWNIVIGDKIASPFFVVILGFISLYYLMRYITVPMEQRTVPKLFDLS